MKVNAFFFRCFFPLNIATNSFVNILNFLGYESFIDTDKYVLITVPTNRCYNFNLNAILNEVFFFSKKKNIKPLFKNSNYYIYGCYNNVLLFNFFEVFCKNYNDESKSCCMFFFEKLIKKDFMEEKIKKLLKNIGYAAEENFFINVVKYIYVVYGLFFHIFYLDKTVLPLMKLMFFETNNFNDYTTFCIKNESFFTLKNNSNYKHIDPIGISSFTIPNKNEITDYTVLFLCLDIPDIYSKYLKRIFSFFLNINSNDVQCERFYFCENASLLTKVKFYDVYKFLKKFFLNNVGENIQYLLFFKKTYNFVFLKFKNFKKILGFFLSKLFIENFLNLIHLSFVKCFCGWLVKNIYFKVYFDSETSLIDEILKYYGFHNDVFKFINLPTNLTRSIEFFFCKKDFCLLINNYFFSHGFQEVINYSFTITTIANLFLLNKKYFSSLKLRNPISNDLCTMRTSLLCNLLSNLKLNFSKKKNILKFFEIGTCFFKCNSSNQIFEFEELSVVFCGKLIFNQNINLNNNYTEESFSLQEFKKEIICFFSYFNFIIKVYVEFFNIETEFTEIFSCFKIRFRGKSIGLFGSLKKFVCDFYNFKNKDIFFFSLNTENLYSNFSDRRIVKNISNYPIVKRDLSCCAMYVIVDREIFFFLNELNLSLFKDYNIQEMFLNKFCFNEVFLKISLYFQSFTKTLDDNDIKALLFIIINYLYRGLYFNFRF